MKIELKNAKISMYVDKEHCKIKVEKAILYMEENGEVYGFEAQFRHGTPIEEILLLSNRTRMTVHFNGLCDQPAFIYSETGQKITVSEVSFFKIP